MHHTQWRRKSFENAQAEFRRVATILFALEQGRFIQIGLVGAGIIGLGRLAGFLRRTIVDAISDKPQPDWDPRSDAVLSDQAKAYDAMRRSCPVAYSDYLGWSLFGHGDVVRALDDHRTFSSVVSSHLSVPSGMDPPQHTAYRRLIERHFEPARVEAFEPDDFRRSRVQPGERRGN